MNRRMGIVAAAGILALGSLPAGAAATNRVQMAVPFSMGSKAMADLRNAARNIAMQSAGRVQVKFVEQPDLDSESGACDGALLAGPVLSRYSPAARVIALPLLFRSAEEAAKLRAQMDARVAADLEARGLSLLALLDLGFAYVHSKQPVETVEQLKAVRLWVPPADPESLRIAEFYGVTPVPLAAPQVRDALRDGTVSAVMVPPLGAILMQWHVEVAAVSATPFFRLCGAVVLRNDALARLEPADQVLVRDELARTFSAAADDLRQKEAESLEVLAQNGVVRHPLGATPEQRTEWETWATTVAARLVAEGFIPAGILEEARRTLAGYRAPP
jgi:TRAP-type transport system periplasmic protein